MLRILALLLLAIQFTVAAGTASMIDNDLQSVPRPGCFPCDN